MRHRLIIGIVILTTLIFASTAYTDFGSFSGNSDYSSSRSSSSSSSSSERSSSSGSYSSPSVPSRSYRTRTENRRQSHEYSTGGNMAGGIDFIPSAGLSSRSGFVDSDNEDDSFDECGGVAFVLVVFFIFWFMIHRNSKKHRDIASYE